MSKKQDVIAEETETVVVRDDTPAINPDAIAAALYARYCEVINPRHPIPLPSWLQLEDLYKDAWRAVAS